MNSAPASLPGTQRPQDLDPIADIIAACEDLLVRARTGELRALAWVAVKDTKAITRGSRHATGNYQHDLTAGIADLFFETLMLRNMAYEERVAPAPPPPPAQDVAA